MGERNVLLILALGVFSIINTEMGVIGILPLIASHFQIDISTAGLLVSLFALAVSVSGPTMPLLFSGMNRKKAMLFVLGIFLVCNVVSAFAANFTVTLVARVLPAFFHPIYCSLAFTVAAASVKAEEAPRAVSKVLMGVSAGMVLGVPIVSFIAGVTSLQIAMLSFAVINVVAFLATVCFIPSMPVKERLSYGTQLGVLKEPIVWMSIAGVIFLNGAVFGVYSYFAAYLREITALSLQAGSMILLLYGLANIFGNFIGGRLLSSRPMQTITAFPLLLGLLYIVLFASGPFVWLMAVLTVFWGILAGAGSNINQYWLVSAAPKAPEFANGLFLSSTNLGTAVSAAMCGFFIAELGMQYIMLGGLLFSLFGILMILMRVRYSAVPQESPQGV